LITTSRRIHAGDIVKYTSDDGEVTIGKVLLLSEKIKSILFLEPLLGGEPFGIRIDHCVVLDTFSDIDARIDKRVRKHFLVSYDRDLTDGSGLKKKGVIILNTLEDHVQEVEFWCYEKFGNRYGFIMGREDSSLLRTRWDFCIIHENAVRNTEILLIREDEFNPPPLPEYK
jgi:hypothetical protein